MMNWSWPWLGLCLLAACQDTATDTIDSGTPTTLGCDDVPPGLCVVPVTLEADFVAPEFIRVSDGDTVVTEVACDAVLETCCTWDVPTGTYMVSTQMYGEFLEQTVDVVYSDTCDHETATVTFVFDVAR